MQRNEEFEQCPSISRTYANSEAKLKCLPSLNSCQEMTVEDIMDFDKKDKASDSIFSASHRFSIRFLENIA